MLRFTTFIQPFFLLTLVLALLLITGGREIQAETAGADPGDRRQTSVTESARDHSYAENSVEISSSGNTGISYTTIDKYRQPLCQTSPGCQQQAGDRLFHKSLNKTIHSLLGNFASISTERRKKLDRLAGVISGQRSAGQTVKLVFICTHNARRSHMGQLWAAAAAEFFGVSKVITYSGGTEVSTFNPHAIAALQRAGFSVTPISPALQPSLHNPHYQVSFSPDRPAMTVFSKKYDTPVNPEKDFVAVMTCDHANNTCPTIAGASFRISLPWADPKEADNTPKAASHYDERVRQIGSEMLYLFARVSDDQE